MLWVAYKLYTEAKDIKDPENVHAHFTDFRTSEQYKKTFIELFERDTKRMGVHLSEATAEGVKPVNEYSIKQESDSIVMRFNPDNMIEQVGQHRIKDKKASFLGADFGVTVKRGGIEEKITPQITNGGKNYTVRIPKSELT